MPSMVRLIYQLKSVLKQRETMLKNSKVVLFVTLKRWSDRKLLDPTTYITVKGPIKKIELYKFELDKFNCNLFLLKTKLSV